MGGYPVVRRPTIWRRAPDTPGKGYYTPADFVIIAERWPDPAGGRADENTLVKLTPDQARYVASELWRLAELIDGKTKKTSVMKKIRQNTAKLAKDAKIEAMG